jgi:hypothetical protein
MLRYILFLAGMGGVQSTRVEILFVFFIACDGFSQWMLSCILCIRWHGLSLFKTMLRCIFWLRWHGKFVQQMLRIILCPPRHWRDLVNKCWDAFWVLASLICVRSTQVEIHFMSSLAWNGFRQHKLRYILCRRWHGRVLVNTSWVAFCVLSGIGGVWSTHV